MSILTSNVNGINIHDLIKSVKSQPYGKSVVIDNGDGNRSRAKSVTVDEITGEIIISSVYTREFEDYDKVPLFSSTIDIRKYDTLELNDMLYEIEDAGMKIYTASDEDDRYEYFLSKPEDFPFMFWDNIEWTTSSIKDKDSKLVDMNEFMFMIKQFKDLKNEASNI